jgi:hypothetical protein
MDPKKVFLVISEKHERIIIRRNKQKLVLETYCRRCREKVEWLTINEVSEITAKTIEEIRDELESGSLDFQVTDDSRLFICRNSVFRRD